jgi:hypothetical protein
VNKQKKQVIILVLLVAAVIGVGLFQMTRDKTPPPPNGGTAAATPPVGTSAPQTQTAKAPGTEPVRTEINVDELLAGIQEVDFDYDRERIPRDVLTPLVGAVSAPKEEQQEMATELVPPAILGDILSKAVSGIVWDANRPVAIVDNEIVYPGYQYPDGTTVESIKPDAVVFKVGDSLIQVELKEL